MRIIVHVDMDAFYAAVEERLNPALRDLSVVVGADPKEGKGRGVVTTANYRARKFGIRSALPISRAWRFAETARARGEPATVFIQPNMPLYREVSGRIMLILQRYADAFEEASIDEAHLDVSSLENFAAALQRMDAKITRRAGNFRRGYARSGPRHRASRSYGGTDYFQAKDKRVQGLSHGDSDRAVQRFSDE